MNTTAMRVRLAGGGEIEIRASESDLHWLRALFTRNDKSFRALLDMGYEVSRDIKKETT